MSHEALTGRQWRFLAGLDQADVDRFCEAVRVRELTEGQWICRPGDPADTFYFVIDGLLSICTESEDGRCVATELLLPGECGGCCCLGNRPGTTVLGARVVLASRVGVVERARMIQMICEMPQLAFGLLDMMQSRERKLEEKLIRVLSLPARERVQAFFADVGAPPLEEAARLPLTHQDIADLLGLTRETVSRAISELRRSERRRSSVAS